jgi:uncharacterized protein
MRFRSLRCQRGSMIADPASNERDASRRDLVKALQDPARKRGAPLAREPPSGRRARLPRFAAVSTADPNAPPREVLREHRSTILALLAERGARDVRVFGSLARGDDDVHSDIDLLVELPDAGSAGAELLTALGLAEELSQLVRARVDVATPRTLRDEVRDAALAEAVPL